MPNFIPKVTSFIALWAVCCGFGVGCKSDPGSSCDTDSHLASQDGHACPSPAVCAGIVLRPGASRGDPRDIPWTKTDAPSVGVAPFPKGTTRSELFARACDSQTSVAVALDSEGIADSKTVAAALGTRECVELTGRAYIDTALVGSDHAIVRRGPYAIHGSVRAPDGTKVAGAVVHVQVGAESLSARTDDSGQFSMTGLSAGTVASADVRTRADNGTFLAAHVSPQTALGPDNRTLNLTLDLIPEAVTVDAFEPDDSTSAAQRRAAVSVGTREPHTLSQNDVDVVPVQLSRGQKVVFRAQPKGAGIDVSLRVIRIRDGAELAHANGPSDVFQATPTLKFSADEEGIHAVAVGRNDGEAVTLSYDFIIASGGV